MVTFTLNIKSDDDAITSSMETEISRLLKETAAKVEAGKFYGPLMDTNGHKIGDWELRDK